MASSKKYINFLYPQKHLPGSAIPEEGVKNLVHTKPELVIEPEEMDFERLERPNADLPKGEKRVVQEGQKAANCAWWKFLQENGVEKPEGTGCLCRTRSSGRNHRGRHERGTSRHSTTRATATAARSQSQPEPQPEPPRTTTRNHNRFRTQSALMFQKDQ